MQLRRKNSSLREISNHEINTDYRRTVRDIGNEIQVWMLRTSAKKMRETDIYEDSKVAVVYSVGLLSWNYSTTNAGIVPMFVI